MKNFGLTTVARASALALGVTSTSHGAIVVFTSQAAFNAAILSPGVDDFYGLNTTAATPGPLNRFAGPYSYTASSTDVFYGAGTAANPSLSTGRATSTITFRNFASGVVGLGGNFFGTNFAGAFAPGSVTLTATDGSGSVTQTIAFPQVFEFLGFVSTGPLTSVTLSAVQPVTGEFLWPTADNLTLALVIPAPSVLATLGLCGAFALRRQR